jgi:3alpha(or 20beta)-hydroxysteroid dehydrogenase
LTGVIGMNGLSAYSASKWAVRGLSRSLALELGPAGIRVCTLVPGGMNTRMNNDGTQPVEELNKAYVHVPLQRIGQPIETARAALFLASDDASYITGCELMVDGGDAAGYYQPGLPGSPEGFVLGRVA